VAPVEKCCLLLLAVLHRIEKLPPVRWWWSMMIGMKALRKWAEIEWVVARRAAAENVRELVC